MEIQFEINNKEVLVITLKGRMDLKGAMEIDLTFTARVRGQRAVIVDMCEFRFNPAGDSDLIPATIPI